MNAIVLIYTTSFNPDFIEFSHNSPAKEIKKISMLIKQLLVTSVPGTHVGGCGIHTPEK